MHVTVVRSIEILGLFAILRLQVEQYRSYRPMPHLSLNIKIYVSRPALHCTAEIDDTDRYGG